MSESGWLQLATLLVGLASMWIGLHFKLKGLDDQNLKQEKKIQDVAVSVDKTNREIDGRLTEYRRLVEQKALVDIAAAMIAGEAKGVAMERERVKGSAAEVMKLAKDAAKEVLATAEEKAKEKP